MQKAPIMDRETFYANKQLKQTVWWLMDCSFPDLQWARQCIFDDGSSDVCLDEGKEIHAFAKAEDAVHFLSEDEYVEVEDLLEASSDYPDMPADTGEPPVWPSHERQSFFYYESY
ncbi:MAG: hypothetical protein JOZ51_21415 [Chloroflexi bacterium]|nr:hypothetical protein [Chloroflexota bacterium]